MFHEHRRGEERSGWRVHTFVYILGKTFVKTFMAHGRFSFSERTSQRAAGDGAVVVKLGSTHAPALPLRIPKKAEKHILRSAYTHTYTRTHLSNGAPYDVEPALSAGPPREARLLVHEHHIRPVELLLRAG